MKIYEHKSSGSKLKKGEKWITYHFFKAEWLHEAYLKGLIKVPLCPSIPDWPCGSSLRILTQDGSSCEIPPASSLPLNGHSHLSRWHGFPAECTWMVFLCPSFQIFIEVSWCYLKLLIA